MAVYTDVSAEDLEAFLVELPSLHQGGEVDRTQVAALVGKQGLLPAGIGGLDAAQLGRGVVAVDLVEEQKPRISAGPGRSADGLEDLARGDEADDLAVAGID